MFCHSSQGECDPREIAEALGLRYDELWDEPLRDCVVCGKRTMPSEATGEWIHGYCAARRDGKPIPVGVQRARSRAEKKERVGAKPPRLLKRSRKVLSREVVEEYEHVDVEGVVVARSLRYREVVQLEGDDEPHEDKAFSQLFARHDGGWGKSDVLAPETIVPIWRLAEVQLSIAAEEPVYLTEGHKDAKAIVAAGGEGTTNIDGAGNLSSEDTDQLAGAHVIVVCDRDAAGFQRGLKALTLLEGVAASVEVVLPAVTSAKADAFDHLEAGHRLEDFVPTDGNELQRLLILAKAERILDDVREVPAELIAREERADAAELEEERISEHAHADRWAVEIGRQQFQQRLVPLHDQLKKVPGCTRDEVAQLEEIIDQARDLAVEAYGRRHLHPDHELAELLGLTEDVPQEPVPDNVRNLPGATWRPQEPRHPFPMAMPSAEFAYSLGDDGFPRGVWMMVSSRSGNGPWRQIGDLPYVHQRVIKRDGRGKRTGLHYLLSAEADGTPLKFDLAALKDGSWANHLGIELSQDMKIISAVATAIIYAAKESPEHEATPDIDRDTGKIVRPAGIDQYFECAPVSRDDGLEGWRQIVAEVVRAPKLALVLGASAIAPFVHSLGKSHTVSMTGGPMQGKSIALRLAAGLWGDSVHGNGSMYSSWNATGQGLPRLLGTLRVLPVFRDETGLAGQSPEYWAKLAYQISEGIDRLRYDRMTDYSMDKPWWGILFSTGNEQFADGCNNGRFQGVPRRVIDLTAPFTSSADQGDLLFRADAPDGAHGLLEGCYGHLGATIADDVTVSHAIEVIDRVPQLLTCPPPAAAIEHLIHMHVAGAMIIDELLGTGDQLTTAAAAGAQAYLDSWHPPAREADQVIDLVMDSIVREPSRWPTKADYAEHLRARAFSPEDHHTLLPQSGVARELLGIRSDDHSWVGIFASSWTEVVGPEINRGLACEQLADDNILRVQDSRRKRKEWVNQVRVTSDSRIGSTARVYQLYLPTDPDPAGDDETANGPTPDPASEPASVQTTLVEPVERDDVAGDVAGVAGPVSGEVAGTNVEMTRDVAGVAGRETTSSRSTRAKAARSEREAAPDDPDFHSQTADPTSSSAGSVPLDPARPVGVYSGPDGVDHHRGWAAEPGTCVVCGQPCVIVLDGVRVHPLCLDRNPGITTPQPPSNPVAPADGDRADHSAPNATAEQPRRTADQQPSRQPAAMTHRVDERWSAPAAVVTGDTVIVPGTDPISWEATHLGHLALLARALRLGWGGDADRLPAVGQLWLTREALERLGLPTELELPEGQAMSPGQWAKAKEKAFAKITKLPAVTAAVEAGWEFGRAGLGPWTRIWHPEQLRGGALLVALPWQLIDRIGVIQGDTEDATDEQPDDADHDQLRVDDTDPAALAGRLAEFARRVGIPYRFTPSITGLDLIDYTRPPKASADDDLGANRKRVSLIRNEPAELPEFLTAERDNRFANLEGDWSWWRPYESLLEEERACRYVTLYDRGRSYLAPWSSIDLGISGLVHETGDQAKLGREGETGLLSDRSG